MNKIQIETLTPVHIGSGNMLQNNTDFVVQRSGDDQFIYIVDDRKILDLIGEEHLDHWLASIENKESTIQLVQRFASKASLKDYTTERIICYATIRENDTLKEIIHDGRGKPYIPGSSIKGAIRTAVLAQIIAFQDDNQIKKTQEKVFFTDNSGRQKVSAVNIEKELFGDNPNADIFRFVRVGDAYFEGDCMIARRMINLNIRNNQDDLIDRSKAQLIEAIGTKKESVFEMKIDTEYYDYAKKYYKDLGELPENMRTLSSLFRLINRHTSDLVQSEISFWLDDDLSEKIGSEDYIEKMRTILADINQCEKGKECVLRIGHASGWRFITGAWAEYLDNFDDVVNAARPNNQKKYHEYDFPKTRRIDEDSDVYGFVKLKIKE